MKSGISKDNINPIMNNTESLNRYFNDIRKKDLRLSDININDDLLNRIKNGDKEAIDILIHKNLKFVLFVAKSFTNNPKLFEDLVSEGNIGLVEAARTYDPTKGFKFISYAVHHIKKNILTYFYNNKNTVRLPQNKINLLKKINEVENDLFLKLNRQPTDLEISDEFNYRYSNINRLVTNLKPEDIYYYKSLLSINVVGIEDSKDDDSLAIIDKINGDISNINNIFNQNKILVKSILNSLNEYEKDLIIKRFGLNGSREYTLKEIGNIYSLTNEAIRLKINRILRKIKNRVKYKYLENKI